MYHVFQYMPFHFQVPRVLFNNDISACGTVQRLFNLSVRLQASHMVVFLFFKELEGQKAPTEMH